MKKQLFKTGIPLLLLATALLLIGPGCRGTDPSCSETIWYQDNDGDGYGNADEKTEACNAPQGYVEDNTDCDDTNDTVYPGATELCDGLDNNCDGEIDNSTTSCEEETICVDGACVTATTFYRDNDNDGFGNSDDTMLGAGTPPEGWVLWAGDCDDNNDMINVLANEIMGNNIDDNCDGFTDEGVRYLDIDGDGYGSQEESAADGVFNNLDCDDTNPDIHPYRLEIFDDGIDNDCDGGIDEN